MSEWLPALDGVTDKLERGAKVADVGCGHGASTDDHGQGVPEREFHGFDYHAPSLERARRGGAEAGVADRISVRGGDSQAISRRRGYDLVGVFDCLHDMGDPVAHRRTCSKTLDADGTWMIVEPFAGDDLASNHNPVGRVFYGASTVICTPASLAQEVGLALGAQAGRLACARWSPGAASRGSVAPPRPRST